MAFLKAGAFLLAAAILAGEGEAPDYRVSVSYHANLVRNLEWRIAVIRTGKRIVLDVDRYQGGTSITPLPRDEYMKLVDFMNRKGIWRLKGNYPEGSPNAFHVIEVMSGRHTHSFKVEAGPLLSGESSRYREIIRRMENLARMKTGG
ncbi:MAG TPA: hypothetical protein PKY31_17365 [Spirochaetota bacterium]|nr:hypothetical protein [Spirochaetota bacterium]